MAKYWRETEIGELTEKRAGKTQSLYIPLGSSCLATSMRILAGQLGHAQLQNRRSLEGKLRILRTPVHRNPGFVSTTVQRTCFLNITKQLVFCGNAPKNVTIRIPNILGPVLKASQHTTLCINESCRLSLEFITCAFKFLVLNSCSRLKRGELVWTSLLMCKCNNWCNKNYQQVRIFV